MSGLPTLLVQLDDGTGAFPYDITAYVDMKAGWSADWGRRDEFSEVDAAVARLVLDNRDGRFTLGSVTYGITVDQMLRITETAPGGGTPQKRITGYVQEWPVEWDDQAGLKASCRITVVDRQARLERQTLDNVLASELLRDDPAFLYMLGEDAGATGAGDTSGNVNAALAIAGSAPVLAFGGTALLDDTGVTFAANGQYLRGSLLDPATTLQTVGCTVVTTATPAADVTFLKFDTDPTTRYSVEFGMSTTGQAQATIVLNATPFTITHPLTINDGLPHRLSYRFNPGTGDVVLTVDDGVEYSTVLGAGFAVLTFGRVTVGNQTDGTFTVLGVTGYAAYLAVARVRSHYAAQGTLTTDSSDERIERLAAYAGITAADLNLETGVLTSVDQQTTDGTSVWSAMTDVVKAEGGTLFVQGDGKLTMQNRYHRADNATQTAAVQLDSDDVRHSDLRIVVDKQYLYNVVRGSRRDGAQQTYRNAASVAKYGEYPQDYSSLLVTTDAEVADRITWQGTAYSEVAPRINSVTIDMLTMASTVDLQDLMELEVGDLIRITGLPSTQAPSATVDLIVEGVSEKQSVTEWDMTLNTVSADLYRAWVLQDATYGQLGVTTRLHF